MKNIPFSGILAVGDTKRQAADNYRSLALGQNVAAYRDAGSTMSFISNSSSDTHMMFNPSNGGVDIVRSDDLIADIEFASESSSKDAYPYHAVCSDGCGKHVVFDSESLAKFCPMCTCALSAESSDETSDEDEALALLDSIEESPEGEESESSSDEDSSSEDAEGEDDAVEGDDADDADGEDEGEDDADLGDDTEGEDDADEEEGEDDLSDLEDDGEESESSSDDGVVVASDTREGAARMFLKETGVSTSSEGTHEAEYVVCSSADCGAHIMHNTESLSACPVCLSSVQDPEDMQEEATEDDLSDLELDSESSDDADADDTNSEDDVDFDDEGESDEIEAEDDGETSESSTMQTAVSFSSAGARSRFLELNKQFLSQSSDAQLEVEYVVCSSADCGAHIMSVSHTGFCPVCASETQEPETEGSDKVAKIMGDLGVQDEPKAEEKPAEETVEEPKAEEKPAEETVEENPVSESGDNAPATMTEIDALALVDDTEEGAADNLDVSYSASVAGASQWTAFYKGNPVATARAVDAGKNADLFDKPTFGQAVLSAAAKIGVKPVLKDLGFKPIVHRVPVSVALSKMVDERVAAERASLSADKQQHAERFQAALATATIGINRGFFKVHNPLKAALCSDLATAGVRNPEALVDAAFAKSFEAFSKVAHAKAEEILARPPEVQESLASAVLDMSYMSEASALSAASLESRLSTIGVSASSDAGANKNNNIQQSTSGIMKSESSSFEDDLAIALGSLGANRR